MINTREYYVNRVVYVLYPPYDNDQMIKPKKTSLTILTVHKINALIVMFVHRKTVTIVFQTHFIMTRSKRHQNNNNNY